ELARRVCPCSGLVRFGALVVADDAVERAAARIRERATIALDVPQPGSHLTDAAIDCAELEIGLHAEDALRRARNRIAEIGICRLEASIDCLAQWAGRGDCEPLKTVRTSLGREHDGGLGGRSTCLNVDDPSHGVRAVHCRERTARYLDTLDLERVDCREVVAAAARIGWVVDAYAVDQHDGEVRFGAS